MCLLALAPATAAEELQEADVLWPDHHGPDDDGGDQLRQQPHCSWSGRKPACPCEDAARGGSKARRPGLSPSSVPVAIDIIRPVAVPPSPTTTTTSFSEPAASSFGGGDDDDETVLFVPPHVALEQARRRRWSEGKRASSSVCVGLGRTLKGRDLQSVRTAVLRMTGFIET